MADRPKPRYLNVTAILGVDILASRDEQLKRDLESVRERPERQSAYYFLAGTYWITAFEAYALGHPLESVIELFKKCAAAKVNVLRLRGTEKYTRTTPTTQGTLEHIMATGITEVLTNFGTGNSWEAFESAWVALSAGDFAAVAQIAEMIWDPPDAHYIGRRSEICTPEQQKVAYAFRDIYLGRPSEAVKDLPRISLLWKARRFPKDVAYEAAILRSIAASDGNAVLGGITSLLFWHGHEPKHDLTWTERYSFLCLPALGLSAFAISRGLLKLEQLPQDKMYFPVEMLRLATKVAP